MDGQLCNWGKRCSFQWQKANKAFRVRVSESCACTPYVCGYELMSPGVHWTNSAPTTNFLGRPSCKLWLVLYIMSPMTDLWVFTFLTHLYFFFSVYYYNNDVLIIEHFCFVRVFFFLLVLLACQIKEAFLMVSNNCMQLTSSPLGRHVGCTGPWHTCKPNNNEEHIRHD